MREGRLAPAHNVPQLPPRPRVKSGVGGAVRTRGSRDPFFLLLPPAPPALGADAWSWDVPGR